MDEPAGSPGGSALSLPWWGEVTGTAKKIPLGVLFLCSGALSGCGGMVAAPPASGPTVPSEAGAQPEAGRPGGGGVEVSGAGVSGAGVSSLPATKAFPVDAILDSPWALTPEMEGRVQEWIESFQTREAQRFRASLARMGRYREMVEEELRDAGLPASLAFLPIVESWYNPRAVSWVGAAGLWQFMPSTARGLGLQVDRLVDERRDPYLATAPALAYLAELNRRFDSWLLALAAYNGGPGRLQRILRRAGKDGRGHDGLFLELLRELPRETRHFVPRFLAAARIGRDPAAYGFGDVVPDAPWSFEEIVLPDATSMDVIARASQVDQDLLEELNPQLLRGYTPAGVETRLRVPQGVGTRFAEAYARIPPEERVTFLEHWVRQGETLTHIALRYEVSVADLQAANPRIRPRYMQIGERVVVPKAPSAGDRVAAGTEERARSREDRLVVYRVQSGDTLSAIAARHRVGVGDLLRWNGLSLTTIIRPGDQVKIYLPGG